MPLVEKKKTEMWYAVETAFINGTQYKSIPCFKKDVDEYGTGIQPGTCMRPHYEEPMNTCQTFLNGIIEIHTDWFQTKEQAMQFINGSLTYVITRREEYRKDINSTLSHFVKWEAVPANGEYLPYRGVYKAIKPDSW